ncbi:unnamed protein product, partial [Amoebophrya sp. A120]
TNFRLRPNWPTGPETACFPTCGSNQSCLKQNGVYFVPLPDADAYCNDSDLSAAEILQLKNAGTYPTEGCRESCCQEGCKQPSNTDKARLEGVGGANVNHDSTWKAALESATFLPLNQGWATIATVQCKSEWDPAHPAKFR